MAATVPTKEPETITAGDSAEWIRSFSDYPANAGWTLSYAFLREGDGQQITISATASGADHAVNLLPADTAGYLDGQYYGQAYVTSATKRVTVGSFRIQILPNFAGASNADPRSKAKRILDALDGVALKLATKSTVSATIEGVQMVFRDDEKFIKIRNYWLSVYQSESPDTSKRRILGRFVSPT
jgi:hypothetical protein